MLYVYKLDVLFMHTDGVCHLNVLLIPLNQQSHAGVK